MDPVATTDPKVIEREIHIDAAPSTVFAFFIDPDRLRQWMGRTVEVDPRPGGRLRIDYNGEDIASGEYLDVQPPTRVVFSWGWEMPGDPVPPGGSTVEVTLTPDGDGTHLRLRHLGLPSESVEGHAVGWDQFLPKLAEVAAADPSSSGG